MQILTASDLCEFMSFCVIANISEIYIIHVYSFACFDNLLKLAPEIRVNWKASAWEIFLRFLFNLGPDGLLQLFRPFFKDNREKRIMQIWAVRCRFGRRNWEFGPTIKNRFGLIWWRLCHLAVVHWTRGMMKHGPGPCQNLTRTNSGRGNNYFQH